MVGLRPTFLGASNRIHSLKPFDRVDSGNGSIDPLFRNNGTKSFILVYYLSRFEKFEILTPNAVAILLLLSTIREYITLRWKVRVCCKSDPSSEILKSGQGADSSYRHYNCTYPIPDFQISPNGFDLQQTMILHRILKGTSLCSRISVD